jgi:co-chaperonin GroES (HSP10)
MPRTTLEPASDYLIVADMPQETEIGGISMPDNIRQQEMIFGVVMFVGPTATSAKPQDRVCYGPYAGKGIVLDGKEFRLLRIGQIEAYLREVE